MPLRSPVPFARGEAFRFLKTLFPRVTTRGWETLRKLRNAVRSEPAAAAEPGRRPRCQPAGPAPPPGSLRERSRGRHRERAANREPGRPGPTGAPAAPRAHCFPGARGPGGGGGGPPHGRQRRSPTTPFAFQRQTSAGPPGGTYRPCTGRGSAPAAAPRPPPPRGPRRRPGAPRGPRRRGAAAAAAAAARAPREQSPGAWLRGRGGWARGGLGSGAGPWTGSARRLRADDPHGSAGSEQGEAPGPRRGSPGGRRSELPAQRPGLRRDRGGGGGSSGRPAPPRPAGPHSPRRARQPIARAPAANPLLFPAPPRLRRKGAR